jgi:hypothetical protein
MDLFRKVNRSIPSENNSLSNKKRYKMNKSVKNWAM